MILEVPDYVTRKKLRVEKERYLLTRERNDYNLGEKVMRFLDFLTHRMPIPRIWYRYDPSPHPTLVKIVWSKSEMMQPDFQHCFFFSAGRGSICSCQFFQEPYLETGHGNVHFSQDLSSPFLFSPNERAGVFEISLIALKKKTKMAGCETDENRKKLTKVFLLNYVRRMAGEDMRHKAIALTN